MANGINAPYGLNAYQNLSGNADITKIQSFQIDPTCPSIFAGSPVVMAQYSGGAMVGVAGTIIPLSALSAADQLVAPILGYLLSVEYVPISTGNVYSHEFPFWAAGTQTLPTNDLQYQIVAKVNIDPHVMMQVQVSTSGNNLSDTIFLNKWINYSGALSTTVGVIARDGACPAELTAGNYNITQNPAGGGNVYTGNSYYYLDGSTITAALAQNAAAAVSTGNFKVMGVARPSEVFNVGNQDIENSATISNLVVGTSMPFVNVFGKFNNHVYAAGTKNPAIVA